MSTEQEKRGIEPSRPVGSVGPVVGPVGPVSPVSPGSPVVGRAAGRARLGWSLLGLIPLIASATPLAWIYLVNTPQEVWQVDLQVYREGARALADGFPIYEFRTEQPQFLPFTYPPFAAFTALPLLLASFTVMGWVWTVLQMALLWYTAGLAFRPFLSRFGNGAGFVQGLVAAGCVWLMPVSEGVRFGQVNAVIVALCLWDLTRRHRIETGVSDATVDDAATVDGRGRSLAVKIWDGGSGAGVALAAAVKLTPAVFWLHWALSRRWRALSASIGTAALVTLAAALILPPASAAYWTDALLDPGRLGPNGGTSNQSIRGFLLRVGPKEGSLATVLWAAAVIVVLVLGLSLARRFDRMGDPVAVVATIGMVAFLISPVSWVHHMQWGVVVIGALLGTGRDWRRVIAALVAAALLWMRLPWWGANLVADPSVPRFLARVVQNSFTEFAVLALIALWLLVARRSAGHPDDQGERVDAGPQDVGLTDRVTV